MRFFNHFFQFANYDNITVGIITSGFGFGSIINACLNVVWYILKHPDVKKYSRLIFNKVSNQSTIFNDGNVSAGGRPTPS